MIIESQRAEISTATIEIRTLVIDRRQVTMATFRQIPVDELLTDTMELGDDQLWGTVNYYSADDEKRDAAREVRGPRLHVLFVRQSTLRRCVVRGLGRRHDPRHWDNHLNAYVEARVWEEFDGWPLEDDRDRADAAAIWDRLESLPQLYIAT